ncbi:cupin domain-containing protein [Streptantibioticus rubrisoli]|uniref:Cupin domain-containing protein n=1 Tax=Streptantibioticus rubrisoli TaxID=1387313 RepID=A0ABT1PI99_9ACTN|nr:cupin domain-containing protein [Streptantibioticus rubrisoli]MCQ4045082.1 cupin domain-containing protein [Streptantibioticus rubrisoli]
MAATRSGGEQVPGVWTKELLNSAQGDSFSLLRLAAGGECALTGSAEDRILVLDGRLSIAADGTGRAADHRSGAYAALPGDRNVVSSADGALALVLTGRRLGAPADDVFSPQGWQESGPGQWFRLLLDVTFDENFDERVVGLSYFEPGSSSPRHPHHTAHRFLFLDGEADDELVFPDGTRRTAHRSKGDFVDYPHPIEHQTFSGTGCTILFLHEPIPTAEQ